MQVILKENIENVGKAGDVINVTPGYARNFLFPHGKAVAADPNNLKSLEHHRKALVAKQINLKKESEECAKKLAELSVTIQKGAGEGDKLFGSVTAKEIAAALAKEQVSIDKKQIVLEEPIKQLGVFEVPIKLHPEVIGKLKVWVVKES